MPELRGYYPHDLASGVEKGEIMSLTIHEAALTAATGSESVGKQLAAIDRATNLHLSDKAIDRLLADIKRLEPRMPEHAAAVADLEDEVDELRRENEDLEVKVGVLTKELHAAQLRADDEVRHRRQQASVIRRLREKLAAHGISAEIPEVGQ